MLRVLRCDNRLPILIWPNPAKTQVQVSGLPEGSNIRITDAAGREVSRINNATPTQIVSVESLVPGIYQVIITNNQGGSIEVQKLMKQ